MASTKSRVTKEYYNIEKIMGYDVPYRLIIGSRSNGKTYAVKKMIIDRLAENDHFQFGYCRRLHEYIVRDKLFNLFDDIEDYCVERLGSSISFNTKNGFYLTNDKTKKTIGHCFCVEDSMKYKGLSYPNVKLLFFDEFMDTDGYMDGETSRFLNIISTIRRMRKDFECIMVANTITEYCPYFELFKIDVNKIKQGYITYGEHKKGVKFAIEWCRYLDFNYGTENQGKDDFLGFDDNNETSMILNGTWETENLFTKELDDVRWNYKDRRLIPIYFTGFNKVFEISYTGGKQYPVVFFRRVNTQDGMVNDKIKFNVALDDVVLKNKNGIVPKFATLSPLMGEGILNVMQMFDECIKCGRYLTTTPLEGTEFLTIYREVMKR